MQHYFYLLKHVAFFVINFYVKNVKILRFLGQNLAALVITNQNLLESKKRSRIKTIKIPRDDEYFFSFVCHDAHKQRENICYLAIIKKSTHKRFPFSNTGKRIFFSFVCHDAHKQRENIWYLIIIKDSTHK